MSDGFSPEQNGEVGAVLVLAPYAHRAGHFGEIALALAAALNKAAVPTRIICSLPIAGGIAPEQLTIIHSCGRVWSWILHLAGSARATGIGTTSTRMVDVLSVMTRALALAPRRTSTVFHFIDGTFALLAIWVLVTRCKTVYYTTDAFTAQQTLAAAGASLRSFLARLRLLLLRQAAETGRMKVVCETTAVQRDLTPLLGPVVDVVPYAIATVAVSSSGRSVRERLNLPHEAFVALLFGTHREGKDYRTVIQAAQSAERPIYLLFVGEVISSNDPAPLAHESGFSHARFVSRFVDESEVPGFFAAANAVVLPYEGNFARGSGVLLQACRFDTPLIVADTGHLGEFVRQYRCGYLYQQGNVPSLASVMDEAAASPATVMKEIHAGLQRAAEEHSWDRIVPRYVAIYRALLRNDVPTELVPVQRNAPRTPPRKPSQ